MNIMSIVAGAGLIVSGIILRAHLNKNGETKPLLKSLPVIMMILGFIVIFASFI